MEIKFINPYSAIAPDITNGLDEIANNLAPLYPNQTIDDLVNEVYNYINTMYDISMNTLQERSMKSLLYNFLNGYILAQSGNYLQYDAVQMNMIMELLEGTTAQNNPEDISFHIEEIQEQISESNMSVDQQMP